MEVNFVLMQYFSIYFSGGFFLTRRNPQIIFRFLREVLKVCEESLSVPQLRLISESLNLTQRYNSR